MADTNKNQHKEEQKQTFRVESDSKEFMESVEHGVEGDDLNYKRLFFWTSIGLVLLAVFLYTLVNMFDYTQFVIGEKTAADSQFSQIHDLKQHEQKVLHSFGVVDQEQGLYRIPIDSAITLVAEQSK